MAPGSCACQSFYVNLQAIILGEQNKLVGSQSLVGKSHIESVRDKTRARECELIVAVLTKIY